MLFNVQKTLGRLRHPDVERRQKALSRIAKRARRGLSDEEVREIVAFASADLPPKKYELGSYDESLLRSVLAHLRPSHVEALVARFEHVTPAARSTILWNLASIDDVSAARAWVSLLQHHGWPEVSYGALIRPFEESRRHGDVILMPLVDGSIQDVPEDMLLLLLLAYGAEGKIPPDVLALAVPRAVARGRALVAEAREFQQGAGTAWRYADEYAEVRFDTGLVLDALGGLGGGAETVALLREGETLTDPRPRLFAVASLAGLGETPDPCAVRSVAAEAETRVLLLQRLTARGRADLFPDAERTQERLAESEMVGWLTYPAELGRPPDAIELMRTVEADAGARGGGRYTWFVFRFRTEPPHWAADDGWMAGVAGPFRNADFPTTEAWGDTFSAFEAWDEATPEEHLSGIVELMRQWRAHRG